VTDTIVLDAPLDAAEEQALPATRVRGYWQSVFYRLRSDPVTLVFAAIVLLIVLAVVFAPLLAPFDPYKEGPWITAETLSLLRLQSRFSLLFQRNTAGQLLRS
jgi:hypothetical protein